VTYKKIQFLKLCHNEMRCPLGGGDNEEKYKELFALGQWDFTAWCATTYECSEVGVPTSTYVVGYCSFIVCDHIDKVMFWAIGSQYGEFVRKY